MANLPNAEGGKGGGERETSSKLRTRDGRTILLCSPLHHQLKFIAFRMFQRPPVWSAEFFLKIELRGGGAELTRFPSLSRSG